MNDYNKLMEKARRTNQARDKSDRRHGFLALSDAPTLEALRTVHAAIQAGIVTDDWSTIGEAQATLEHIIERDFN